MMGQKTGMELVRTGSAQEAREGWIFTYHRIQKRPSEIGRAVVHANTARVCSLRWWGTMSGANLTPRVGLGFGVDSTSVTCAPPGVSIIEVGGGRTSKENRRSRKTQDATGHVAPLLTLPGIFLQPPTDQRKGKQWKKIQKLVWLYSTVKPMAKK